MPGLEQMLNNINKDTLSVQEPDPRIPEELFLSPTLYDEVSPMGYDGFTHKVLGDIVFTNRAAPNKFRTRTHEAQHGTQNALSEDYNDLWKHNSNMSHAEFLGRVANRAPTLRKAYPDLGAYFKQAYLDRDVSKEKLQEVFAALIEHERSQGPMYDVTKDPIFKGIWDDKTSAAFRAMTGMRNLRTDPKDPPAGQVDTGQAWYGR